jgi:hypothetical protein
VRPSTPSEMGESLDPPEDWNSAGENDRTAEGAPGGPGSIPKLSVNKKIWPYNLSVEGNQERHSSQVRNWVAAGAAGHVFTGHT